MAHPKLAARPRTVLGKKVKALRRAGRTPANIYGFGGEPLAIEVDSKELERLANHVTPTTLIDVTTDGGAPTTVLLRELQIDPRRGTPVHAAFMRVNMRQKIRARVPVLLTGEAPAAEAKDRLVLHILEELEVEALPDDLPVALHADATRLDAVDSAVHVRDIPVPPGVVVHHDPEDVVAKVQAFGIAVQELAEAAAERAEGEAAAATEEGAGEETAGTP